MSLTATCSRTFATKTKKNCFPFFTPFKCYLCELDQPQSILFRVEKKEREIQRGGKGGGFQGVKFKFVIPHVQVNIKMLQLVQRSCQQDRFRAGQVPWRVCTHTKMKNKIKQKGGLEIGRTARLVNQSMMQCTTSSPCIFSLSL